MLIAWENQLGFTETNDGKALQRTDCFCTSDKVGGVRTKGHPFHLFGPESYVVLQQQSKFLGHVVPVGIIYSPHTSGSGRDLNLPEGLLSVTEIITQVGTESNDKSGHEKFYRAEG